MACPLSCTPNPLVLLTVQNTPLVCDTNGIWKFVINNLQPGSLGCGITTEICGPGGYNFITTTATGNLIVYLPLGSSPGVYTIKKTAVCNNVQGCQIITVVVTDYNVPLSPILVQNQGNAFCEQPTGFIDVVVPVNSQGKYYVELWQAGVCIQNCNTLTNSNTITFSGLDSGTYQIVNNRVSSSGSMASCSESITVIINDSCVLKATSCPDPAFPLTILIFDGAGLPVSVINKTIKAVFNGYAQRCWTITETTDPTTAVLASWIGPYDDCDTCSSVPCADILSSIVKTDELCNQANGTASVTPLNGTPPYIYQWSNGGNTQSISGVTAGPYVVTIIDVNDCEGANSVIINNIPCSNYYILTPCDTDVRAFVIKDPVTSPNPNPNTYVGNVFEGTVTLSNGNTLTGCFNLIPTAQVSNATASINVTFYSHADCSGCLPPTWQITRCDDNNIFYFTNTDLSAVENQVINNVIMSGCDSTTLPCGSLPDQCWIVSTAVRFEYPVIVESYGTIYPDCDCCKPC